MKKSDRKRWPWKLGFGKKLLLVLGLCMIACLLTVALYTRDTTRNTMRQNALETGIATTDNRAMMLELNLAQIARLSSNLYSNADVYSLLRKSELTNTQIYRISLFLRSMMSMSADVKLKQIYLDIYGSGQSFIINSEGSSSSGPSRYHVVIPSNIAAEQVYCEGPHLTNSYGYNLSSNGTDVFTFHWKLYDNAQENVIGTISFDVALSDMVSYVFPNAEETGFLLSGGNIIFANNCVLTNQTAREILRNCIRDRWSEVHNDAMDGIAFYSTVTLSNVDLQLVQMIQERELYADADSLVMKNTAMICLCFMLCSVLMSLAVGRLMKPIEKLDMGLQMIRTQDNLQLRMGEMINYHADDEVGRLIAQTDNMLDTVDSLFQRQEMLSKAQRDAEARMLQAQINPHFLYNSLQSLAALALERGQKDIFRYITMLGARMHYSMDMEHTTALLAQEFDYVHSYLVLQNVRFKSGIREETDLSPEAAQIVVPRMILQPIVENAFKHGKLCRSAGTYMKMSGQMEENVLTLILENNGLPIEDARVDELNELFRTPGVPNASMNDHIGMLSVLYRLRLYFNDGVTMKLEQPDHKMVRVTITIPLTPII